MARLGVIGKPFEHGIEGQVFRNLAQAMVPLVIRALREAGCPIDFVGGASMGAIIGAGIACGWDDAEIDRRIRKAFVESNPLSDYRLPVVALVKGHRVDARLREHFGDRLIEDLDLPFFAVSTNLTQGTFRVHTQGLLRNALRATISLPGILPPVVSDNQVLVDGAVLNTPEEANTMIQVIEEGCERIDPNGW